ncbi:hypothetical protein LG274_02620 [Micrococcus antarcticus]|uniref:hypothetical protein n=1 Tax=Micrococcus antarcticus TaxID=86171 RepID=UPI00384F86CB
MSALADALRAPASTAPAPRPRPDAPALVDWDGVTGTAVLTTAPQPAAYDSIVEALGFDPEDVQVEGTPKAWTMAAKDGERQVQYWAKLRHRSTIVATPVLDGLLAASRARRSLVPRDGSTAVVVCLADLQIGKQDWRGGTPELIERIATTMDELEAHLRRTNPAHVVLADLGDIVEGMESGGGLESALSSNDLSLPSQIEVAAQIVHCFVELCARYADEVTVAGVGSNHCRLRRGKVDIGTPADDFGLMLMRILRQQYRNHPAFEHVRFVLPAEYEEHVLLDVLGTRIGIVHGHQARSVQKIGDWWAKQSHGGSTLGDADLLLVGHYHHWATAPSGRSIHTGREKRFHVAPTLDNGSSWFRNAGGGADSDTGLLTLTVTEGVGVVDTRVLREGGWL